MRGILVALTILLLFIGCAPAGVTGGTEGMLRMEGKPVENVRLSFYRNDGTNRELQGFAVSTLDGTFRLFQNGATGPLWLSSGEYSVTLESEGAITREWPKEYSDPAKTPLQVNWEEGSKMLDLEIPRARIRY